MKKVLFVMSALALAVWVAPESARAQAQIKVEVKEIEVSLMPTPKFSYDGKSKKLPSAKEWIEVEVEFEVEGRAETEFVDELQFDYFVMMKDGQTMLYESVVHVNVPLKEKIFSDMFISPTTLQKLTGGKATSDAVVAGVAIEVRYQGALIGGKATVSESSRWWQTKARTGGMLLKKADTPFASLWWDRYADVKRER